MGAGEVEDRRDDEGEEGYRVEEVGHGVDRLFGVA